MITGQPFDTGFRSLTGNAPLRWQKRLFFDHLSKSDVPASLDIPTGLGKTSVIAIWYLALSAGASIPRRLVYVVDRRAVVDQATTIANTVKEKSGDTALRVSTLRGQYVDNREWQDDPAAPAIIVGTVDMVGSRLLFSGYGISRRMRPYHAGLLGADALVVLDEAHLVLPFEKLLEAIEHGRDEFCPGALHRKIVPRFRLLSLSATGHKRKSAAFSLCGPDLDDPVVEKRLRAVKRLKFEESVDASDLANVMADRAWERGVGGRRVIVFCNSRKTAQAVHDNLKERLRTIPNGATEAGEPADMIDLIVGERRVYEREFLAHSVIFKRFLSGAAVNEPASAGGVPGFLVCTSAGEVGVDLDADHMVCDLVPWERMVQRMGRVNRLGNFRDGSLIDVFPVSEKDIDKEAEITIGGARIDAWLAPFTWAGWPADKDTRLDASTGALHRLRQDAAFSSLAEHATTPAPLHPALTRALVDAWSMTSLENHTGRPEIAPWLRGWIEGQQPQTSVVWRTHLPVRVEPAGVDSGEKTKKEVEGFFDAAPPHASEKLETETWRVADWLSARAAALLKIKAPSRDKKGTEQTAGEDPDKSAPAPSDILRPSDIVAFALSHAGDRLACYRLGELAESDRKMLVKLLNNDAAEATLVVDARLGGLNLSGLLDPKHNAAPRTADDGGDWIRPLRDDIPVVGFRIRKGTASEGVGDIRRQTYTFATRRTDEGEDKELLAVETWTTEESRAAATRPQLLSEHGRWTEERALALADSLGLNGNHKTALATAARLHDEGKRADRWQRAFNARRDGCYAKTKGPINIALLDGYRHEFGSLRHAENDAMFKALPVDLRDLVLHIIAAHHGRARPLIETRSCDDAPPSALEARARDVALRFARLQKQWGPWGLAWWEALLRAADQQASRANNVEGIASIEYTRSKETV